MNGTYLRIRHFFTARHYRGHGIHSPFLYDFIRTILIKSSSLSNLFSMIFDKYGHQPVVIESLGNITNDEVVFISNSCLNLEQFHAWRSQNRCLSLWLKWGVLIFSDSKLQNQHFDIRS